MRPAHKKI